MPRDRPPIPPEPPAVRRGPRPSRVRRGTGSESPPSRAARRRTRRRIRWRSRAGRFVSSSS
ncbi:hypothetical protein NS206_16200 [Microbacterium testaceum]|nr:hypothetical protein NS283_09565 [Microbacterium testaceum]KTS55514.1 hypothetical protein NS206_16200 [Microbacterium testaceum]